MLFQDKVFAATSISFTNAPASTDQSQDFQVNVSLYCSGCTSDSYLRAVFYPGGTSYFGFTQDNNGSWVNAPGGSCTQYYKVLASDLSPQGTWSGTLNAKPDISNSFYSGPGDYLFKVGRYTSSCTPTWSTETTIAITGPSPTPIPTFTPTSAPTNAPTSTNTPTNSPAPTNTPTLLPTKTPTRRPSPSPTAVEASASLSEASTTGEVLGQSEENATPAASPSGTLRPFIISFALIGGGLGLLSLLSLWQKRDLFRRPNPPNDIIS